jgi:hypothetical protein
MMPLPDFGIVEKLKKQKKGERMTSIHFPFINFAHIENTQTNIYRYETIQ